MNPMKRLSVTIASRIDQAIGQIENHEAVADVTIRQVRRAAAHAKVHLGRVERDIGQLKQRRDQTVAAAATWRRRALGCSAEEEAKALECLKRAKAAEQELASIASRLQEHEGLCAKLTRDFKQIESRVEALCQQRNLMRSRQSTAQAGHKLHSHQSGIEELEAVFERWNCHITELELGTHGTDAVDTLEESFTTAEEADALRAELEQMRTAQENS